MLPVVQGHIPTTVGGGNRTILALDVLTEKLRDQTLEESAKQNKSNIKFIHPGEGYKLSKNAEAKIARAGKKVFTVQLNSNAGKNIVSEISNKSEDHDQTFHIPERKFSHPLNTCDNFPNMTVDPPKKRHCRSLTLPVDRPAPTNWQPQESHVWKPITVIANTSCGGSTQTPFSSGFYPREHLFNGDPLSSESSKTVCIVPRNMNFDAGGLNIPCDIFTPPESPVPRPSSASTCSRHSDGIFSPLNVPWLDQPKYHAFDFRSLSCEDQISCSTTAGSTPSVHAINSHQSSPHRHRIPRCRSQPSVLHDRKYGVKRRRDYDHRPALNFHKMTETAYQRSRSQPLSTPGSKEKRVSKFHEELESVMSLMPIASSPLDNDIPLKRAMESRTSPIHELGGGRSDSAEFLDGELSEFVSDDPVQLIGDENDGTDSDMEEIFPLQDELDLEQIETN